jgi:hypothetical protein
MTNGGYQGWNKDSYVVSVSGAENWLMAMKNPPHHESELIPEIE